MPPTVVLVRHAQAIHNIDSEFFSMEVTVGMTMLTTQTEAYHSVHDPGLSDLGRQQAAELREHLKTHLPPGRKVIVVSPMRRALQTCLIALDWLIDTGVPVILDARWQGRSLLPPHTIFTPSFALSQPTRPPYREQLLSTSKLADMDMHVQNSIPSPATPAPQPPNSRSSFPSSISANLTQSTRTRPPLSGRVTTASGTPCWRGARLLLLTCTRGTRTSRLLYHTPGS
jgi:hypothetical protein